MNDQWSGPSVHRGGVVPGPGRGVTGARDGERGVGRDGREQEEQSRECA
jgi:hypothetical protein